MEARPCPPHCFSDGGSVICCTTCGTQFPKLIEEGSGSEMDSIDEYLQGLESYYPQPDDQEEKLEEQREPVPLLLSFAIVGHEVRSGVVYYFLRLMNDGVLVCTCTIRFNHLKNFHDTFKLGKICPFPPKEILSSLLGKSDGDFIKSRTDKLNEYLEAVGKDESVSSSAKILAHFIDYETKKHKPNDKK